MKLHANNASSYDLPHRVHTSASYPLPSPNGSTILVYGHEQGLRVIWKGGKPFKNQVSADKKSKSNGASGDAIMIMDADDEAPEKSEQPPHQDNPAFDEERGEFDASEPYEPVIQTLDLPLGVEVLHLAFPHLPADAHRSSLESLPLLFSRKLVVAVACSDFSIRVILIPLLPPSPQSKSRLELSGTASCLSAGKSMYGEQMIVLSVGTTHRSIPKGVSITVTSNPLEDPEEIFMDEDDVSSKRLDLRSNNSKPAPRSRSRSRLEDHQWDLLVASHSADLSGLLLIHRIPVMAGEAGLSSEWHIPWRTQYLASPTVSVYFNSALYPAPRHSQLLIAEAKGVVRILDCLPQSRAAEGAWCLSLYTDFENLPDSTSRRKPILDARWILGGKAILVLLAHGKWGVWDLENAGPKPIDGANPPRSVSAESWTQFTLESWVGDSLKSGKLLKSSSARTESRSKLAPMTPGTRKIRQQALFTEPPPQPDGPVRGGLSVSPVQYVSNSRADDEAVLIWHGNTIAVIPSLFIHWQNKVRRSGNLFGSGAKGEPKVINNIQLGGELCREASLIPSRHRPPLAKDDATHPDDLLTGDHPLAIFTTTNAEPQLPFSLPLPLLSSTTDQQLLARGDLDVDGMDRILSSMSNSQTTPTRKPQSVSSKGNKLLMS